MVINDWLSTNVDSGEGNKKVTLTSTPNNTDEDRVTTLVVKGKNKSVSVNVRQLKQSVSEGFVFYVKHYSNIPVSGTNADRVLSVFSCNKPCTLIRYDIYTGQDLGMDFVTEETLEMAEGINNIYLNAESNIVDGVTNPIRFVAYVIVYEGKSYGYFPIAQLGIDPTITVTPNEVEFHKYGGTKTIEITANTNWRISGDNYRPQITFSKTFGKSGTHTISVTAQEYEGVEDLIYNLWVGVGSDVSVPLVIKQDSTDIPQNCFYIEPITTEGTEVMVENPNAESYIYYFTNNEWQKLDKNTTITINERTYFENFYKNGMYGQISLKGLCNVGGNIETLLGEMKEGYAEMLFGGADIVDASDLILPATTLAISCYSSMFLNCISLVNVPELPATELEFNCYYGMFYGCSSLTTAPILSATTLVDGCYRSMFLNCSSLTTAPELPATTLAKDCYHSMFWGCSSLVNTPEELPATTLADWCYMDMFSNCTSLVNAPILPATTLVYSCYNGMFQYCRNLNYIKMLATDISASFCLNKWVEGVAEYGTFVKHPDMDISNFERGAYGIPSGWEVRDYEG